MKTMSKRNYAVILSLILMLFCCTLNGFAASKDGPPVSMEVSSIYGKVGKVGVHVPISVSLYGQSSEPFRGVLAIQTLENGTGEGEEVYEYQYPVEVATAETKTLKLNVPIGQRSSKIHVILKSNSGTTLLTKTLNFDISSNVLSESSIVSCKSAALIAIASALTPVKIHATFKGCDI